MKSSIFKVLSLAGLMLVSAFAFLIGSVEASTPSVLVGGGYGFAVNGQLYDRAALYMDYLIKNPGSSNNPFSPELIAEINNGTKTLDGYAYYVRAKIGIDGRVKVIDRPNNKQNEGYTNLNDAQIEPGSLHIVTDIQIKYGVSATDVAAADVLPDSLIWDNTSTYAVGTADTDSGATGNQFAAVAVQRIPTKFANAEFKLQAGSTVIQEGRIIDCLVNNKNGVGVDGNYALALKQPKVIKPQEPISFDIVYPTGTTPMDGSKYHYVELSLIGMRLRNRA